MRILVVARNVVALIAMSSAIGLPFCIGQEAKPFIVTAEMERQGQGSEPAFPLVDLFDVDKDSRKHSSTESVDLVFMATNQALPLALRLQA